MTNDYGKYMAHTNRKVARSSRIINNAFWKCFSILIKYKAQYVLVGYVCSAVCTCKTSRMLACVRNISQLHRIYVVTIKLKQNFVLCVASQRIVLVVLPRFYYMRPDRNNIKFQSIYFIRKLSVTKALILYMSFYVIQFTQLSSDTAQRKSIIQHGSIYHKCEFQWRY